MFSWERRRKAEKKNEGPCAMRFTLCATLFYKRLHQRPHTLYFLVGPGLAMIIPDMNSSTTINDSFLYSDLFGTELAMPEWEALVTIISLTLVIIVTVVGNILVIISVFTHNPLKITPNYFIVSLAMADLTVSVIVLPINIVYTVLGRWIFGPTFCKMWLTFDVLCCTASILNLCAIALDRFYALHDPIEHARRRTVNFVLGMITLVWLVSCLICLPPLIGWNDWPDVWTDETPCRLTEEPGYIVYSSMGSFYIPLGIIMFVYFKIFQKTRKRLKKRAEASQLKVLTSKSSPEATCNKVVTRVVNSTVVNGTSSQRPGESAILTLDGENSQVTKVENANEMHKFINEKAKISLSKERKAARTMAIIVTTFIVCWLPFFLMYVILPFCSSCARGPKLIGFITWLGYVNSTLNPIIYTIFNMDFREAFKRIISGKAFSRR